MNQMPPHTIRHRATWMLLVLFLAISTTLPPFDVNAEEGKNAPAFFEGEKLVFELKWGVIPAGEAVLEVMPQPETTGQGDPEELVFVMTARTNSFIDNFYKVRNRIESRTDPDLTRSLAYDKQQQEGGRRKKALVRFNWNKMQSEYYSGGKKKRTTPLLPGAFDPLSAFYFVRSVDLGDRELIERPVSDGKKCVVGRARVLRRETVTVAMGTFDTYLIEPDIKDVGGVFEKSKDARIQIWITADHRQIPVKLQSKVVIGHFVGELTSANGPIPAMASAAIPQLETKRQTAQSPRSDSPDSSRSI